MYNHDLISFRMEKEIPRQYNFVFSLSKKKFVLRISLLD